MILAFQCVTRAVSLSTESALLGLSPVIRGVFIAVFGIGTWVLGLLIAYLLYRRYVGREGDRDGDRADDL